MIFSGKGWKNTQAESDENPPFFSGFHEFQRISAVTEWEKRSDSVSSEHLSSEMSRPSPADVNSAHRIAFFVHFEVMMTRSFPFPAFFRSFVQIEPVISLIRSILPIFIIFPIFIRLFIFPDLILFSQDFSDVNVIKVVTADVCVVGGGSAGTAAALAAGREGADVVLVEKQKMLGGTGTVGMVSNWEGGPGCDFAEEIFTRMHAQGGAAVAREMPHGMNIPTGFKMADESQPYAISCVRANPPAGGYRSVVFLPECFDRVIREMLAETRHVAVMDGTEFFHAETAAVLSAESSAESVSEPSVKVKFILVRNTETREVTRIEAKVFIDATGSVFLCRELGCETMLGAEPRDVFGEEGAPKEKPEVISLNALTRCYRVEPRENPRRETVAAEDVTAFPRCAYVSGWKDGPRFINMMPMLPGKDLVEQGYDVCMERSEKIVRNHWAFLQTFPAFEGYELTEIAPMMGIREDYRVKTKYVLREADVLGGWDSQTHPDRIAVADHPCDIHGAGGGLRHVSTAYGVPYRCLIPDSPYENLLVACRGAGFSKIAASSCRLQRTMIQLGHAAGVAAAWASRDGVSVENIDVTALTEKMDAHSRYHFW